VIKRTARPAWRALNRIRYQVGVLHLRLRYKRFYHLAHTAPGMLPVQVYHRLYTHIYRLPDLDIIEIGGGAGATSIAIAWAMQDSGKRSKLIVVEKCEGGSRTNFGGYEQNLAILEGNFERFGVHDRIRLYPHAITQETGDAVKALIETGEIAAFIHDADGLLDRDFALFWPMLRDEGLMVLDDYANRAIFKPICDHFPLGGGKHLRTYRLVNHMIAWGLFCPIDQVGETLFGVKPAGADFARFDRVQCQRTLAQIDVERAQWLTSQAVSETGTN
jgi:predicted O-methyltransferase YrrM